MTFASQYVLLVSLALATGCASGAARPADAARQGYAGRAEPGTRPRRVELRHIYLLSPGPNAKLVVTQSDIPAQAAP
jgi:hypothetical protein